MKEFEDDTFDDDSFDVDETSGIEDAIDEGATDSEGLPNKPSNKVSSSSKRKREKSWTGLKKKKTVSKDAALGAYEKIYGTQKKRHGGSLIDQLSETKQLVSDVFHLSLKNARAAVDLRKLSMELDVLEQQYQLPSS
jgi:hypothetical protein